MMYFTRLLLVLLLILGAGNVHAETAEQRFDAAVEAWLDGDDAMALPELAALASDGHTMARLLLGRIETTDRVLSPYRRSLSPSEARGLFRQTEGEGAFGKSWLAVEAERGNTLAALLLRARQPRPDPALIANLFAMGEQEAADHPTRILALYGSRQQKEALLAEGPLLEDLRPYVTYLLAEPEPRADGLAALRHIAGEHVSADDPDALAMAGTLALGWGFGSIGPENRWRRAVTNWLMTSRATRPVADICRAACPSGPSACAMTMLALTGGYYEVIRMDSPLEAVIPRNKFLMSHRAREASLRRAALTRAETDEELASVAEIAQHSQCLSRIVAHYRKDQN